jgi:multidrug resistance efflux pump
VKSGDRVTAGTPLFEIDAASQQAAVASLEMMRAAREADASFARQQLTRAKTLLSVGAASQQEYDQAATLVKTAEAQLKATEEQIRQQQAERPTTALWRPRRRRRGRARARRGPVSKSTELTTIDDNAGLEVYINVRFRKRRD